MVKAVAQDTQNFITAQSAESKQLNDLRKQQSSFANVKTLQDIQFQLADRGTQNEMG